MKAAIYTRISHDPEWTRLGVQRQEQDCREVVTRRGWEVAGVYEDDDLSAYNGRVRPRYRQLLEDIRAGAVQAVVAWHPDRLHRHPRDLEEFIETVEKASCQVETVKAGPLDLSTPAGRAVARTLGAWGRYESEHKSERLKRKHLQLAEDGQDAGGGRAFGYEDDRHTVRPREATLVREAADRLLAGESLRGICRDWTRRQVPSVRGGKWSPQVMRRMLGSARISGRRERGTVDGKRREMGTIVATAKWGAIISPDKSDHIRSLLSNGGRRLNGHSTKYLLTGGIAVCGLCGASLVARPTGSKKRALVCASGPGFHGCGKIRIQADPLDELISEAVLQAVDGGALAAAMRSTDDQGTVAELLTVEQKMGDLAADWASDRISRVEWDAARQALTARRDGLQRRVDGGRRAQRLDGLPDPLRAAWPTLELHRRRAVISTLIESVVVGPGRRGLNRFDVGRVTIRWKV
jgi:site-specific DNA recombinase